MDNERFDQLYNRILDGDNWDYSTLDELICLVESDAREDGREKMKAKAISALFSSQVVFPNDTSIYALDQQMRFFTEILNSKTI